MDKLSLPGAVMGAPSAAYSYFRYASQGRPSPGSFAPFTNRQLSVEGMHGVLFPVNEYGVILS